MRTVDDYESIIYTAHLDGVAEGRNEAMTEVARNMKATNMPVADIATFTGLSLEEIAAL